eukprot:1003852-Amphidinium_carterae.1
MEEARTFLINILTANPHKHRSKRCTIDADRTKLPLNRVHSEVLLKWRTEKTTSAKNKITTASINCKEQAMDSQHAQAPTQKTRHQKWTTRKATITKTQ